MPYPQAKIDIPMFYRLVREGKTTTEIAKYFGCSTSAVAQLKKKLSFRVAVDTSTRLAPMLNDKSLTILDRYMALIDEAEKDLKWIAETIPPKKTKEYRAWLDQKKSCTEQVRKLISTLADMRTQFYQVDKVEKVIATILQVIGRASPDAKREIERQLREAGINFRASC